MRFSNHMSDTFIHQSLQILEKDKSNDYTYFIFQAYFAVQFVDKDKEKKKTGNFTKKSSSGNADIKPGSIA